MEPKELKLELSRAGFYEALVDVAQGPAFPFFEMVLEETNKAQSSGVTIRVSPTIRKRLMTLFRTGRLLFYLDARGGKIEAWTPDMVESIRILQESGIIFPTDQWILSARNYLSNLLTDTVGEKPLAYDGEKAIEFLRDVLGAGGVLEQIDAAPKLRAIAADIIRSGTKDFNSCVYRLSMAFYHSKNISGQSAVPEIDDPGAAYLGMISSSSLQAKYPRLVESIRNWPSERRTDITKTFICFCMASYLCHSAAKGL